MTQKLRYGRKNHGALFDVRAAVKNDYKLDTSETLASIKVLGAVTCLSSDDGGDVANESRREATVKATYYYAGGSSRYMFFSDIEKNPDL